jgi:hypothetical protein
LGEEEEEEEDEDKGFFCDEREEYVVLVRVELFYFIYRERVERW